MTIKTIVAAVALAYEDDPVLPRALQLAKEHDARLILVHVLARDTILEELRPAPRLSEAIINNARQAIEDAVEAAGSYANRETLVFSGLPYEHVTKVATEEKADLVIVGVGKPANLKEKILGSTADRIVRLSTLPVLIARRPVDNGLYHKVVAAVDFSPAADNALDTAVRLVPDAKFELLHIVDMPLGLEQAMLKTGTSQEDIAKYRYANGKAARKKLLVLKDKDERLSGATAKVAYGNAAMILVSRSRKDVDGLIVLGTHGEKDLSRLLLGSVTRRILGSARSDVLVAGC